MSDFMNGPDGATPLEHEELAGLKFKSVTLRQELDQIESINIESGINWAYKQKKPNILCEGFLRNLHKKLLGDVWIWAGTFRQTEKNIGVDPLHISVQLRELFDNCKAWLEFESYPPLEIAVRFHHLLVKTHPFPNGNGRVSRIMTDLLCTHNLGIDQIDWLAGYDLQKLGPRRSAYIEALREADQYDYTLLLAFASGE